MPGRNAALTVAATNRAARPNYNHCFCIAQMRRFHPFSGHLSVMTAHRFALDGDFGVASAMMPNSGAPPNSAITACSGMKVKNTGIPLSPSKLVILKISTQASPAPMPSAVPTSAPAPSQASRQRDLHTFFVSETALWCVTASATRFNAARKMSGAFGVHR